MNQENFRVEEIFYEKPKQKGAGYIVKKVFKYIGIGIIILAWSAVLLSIFIRGDNDILETPIFSDKTRASYELSPESFKMYRVYPTDYMNTDGAIQLKKCVYEKTNGELELGIRIAWQQLRYCNDCGRIYTVPELNDQTEKDSEEVSYSCQAKGHDIVRACESDGSLIFRLTDSEGNTYAETSRYTRSKNVNLGFFKLNYEYMRISFGGLYFDTAANKYTYEGTSTDSVGTDTEESDEEQSTGIRYYLYILDGDTEEVVFSTCVYDNQTPVTDDEFEFPDEKYFE